jgi:hypothetical protein
MLHDDEAVLIIFLYLNKGKVILMNEKKNEYSEWDIEVAKRSREDLPRKPK